MTNNGNDQQEDPNDGLGPGDVLGLVVAGFVILPVWIGLAVLLSNEQYWDWAFGENWSRWGKETLASTLVIVWIGTGLGAWGILASILAAIARRRRER